MLIPNLLLFYVQDPIKSAGFYEKLFGCKPAATFPTYVAFSFETGFTFALWSTSAKNFVSTGVGNRAELAFMVADEAEVRKLRSLCEELGVTIEQDLHLAIFGLTFVALDPDGHRVRVCIPDR